MFISNCGRNRLRAEHLMRALLLPLRWKWTGKSVKDWYLVPYKHWHIRMFLFTIYNWIYQIFLTSQPKKKNSFVVLFSRSSKRAIADQIFSGLEKILSILLGFRKHVRYVACMLARKLSLDNEKLFEKKKRKYVLIFVFWKTSKQKWLTLCQICLFYSLFTHCGGRML